MSTLTDAALTGKIKAALLLDERIGALGINVNTVDGNVIQIGIVSLGGNLDEYTDGCCPHRQDQSGAAARRADRRAGDQRQYCGWECDPDRNSEFGRKPR